MSDRPAGALVPQQQMSNQRYIGKSDKLLTDLAGVIQESFNSRQ